MVESQSNDSKALAYALRALGRRDHSEAELRSKLERFGFSAPAIDDTVLRCYDYKYLDDRRYALARSREMLRNGRGVGPRILMELRKRGINEHFAAESLQIASAEMPPEEVLLQQLERRFVGFNYAEASDKERRRVVSYFQRRGFELGLIFRLIKK